jgi:hypothetical protein
VVRRFGAGASAVLDVASAAGAAEAAAARVVRRFGATFGAASATDGVSAGVVPAGDAA